MPEAISEWHFIVFFLFFVKTSTFRIGGLHKASKQNIVNFKAYITTAFVIHIVNVKKSLFLLMLKA